MKRNPSPFALRLFLSRSLLLAVLILAPGSLLLAPVAAQSASATLSGTVLDPNSAVVPGANITVTEVATGVQRTATTNNQGYFSVPLLKPSTYLLQVEHQGFLTAEVRDIILNVGGERALRIQMKVGDVKETVNITGETPLINESPAVATVVDRQFVENIPLNGRSFQSLIALTPGVVFTKANSNEQGQFSVNGQRASSNYFTVDGVSANIGTGATTGFTQSDAGAQPGLNAFGGTNNLVSVDALQEFRVLTSTFAPEFGRTPGAQVQIVTRSGTNEFRGTLFEYLRNDVFDANDWFANATRQPKPPTRQNDFGGVIGGPLFLPRFGEGGPAFWNGKNKTFFFFSYEGLRLRQPQTGITTVPSLNARATAPASMQPFLNAFPRPNGRDLANNFSEFNATFSNPSTLDSTGIRIDHTVNSKLTVFGRYSHAPSETVQRGGNRSLNTLLTGLVNTQTLTGGATFAITPTIINDFRLNYSRNKGAQVSQLDTFGGAMPPPDSALFPSFAPSGSSTFVFGLTGGTLSSFFVGKPAETVQRQINLVDTITVVTGAHQLKFGVDYRRLFPIFNRQQYSQQAGFNGGVNQALTGRASFAFISSFAGTRFPIITNVSLFGQDTWKLSPRLTLTYGLRWEVNPPPREKNGKDGLAINGIDDPTQLSFVLPQGTPIYKTTYDNFAPRVGAAYLLSNARGKETVLRGGFGIFYDLGTGLAGFGSSFPNTISTFLAPAGGLPFPFDLATAAPPPFPSLTPPINVGSSVVQAVDPNLELPYTYQWNFSVEQSLGPNQTISASYLGAAARRLYYLELLQNSNASFPGSVFVVRNLATSDYNALQLQFQRRLSRGLQALASYTWSKSLDTVSNDSSIFPDVRRVNLDQERGPSDFDVRHAFNAGVTYDIPAPIARGFGNAILRDFSIDTTFTARSATPVNIVTGMAAVGGDSGAASSSRPNLIPGISLYIYDPAFAGGTRINNIVPTPAQVAAAGCAPITPTNAKGPFCTPSTNRQGTLGRNALRGFGMWQMDLALRRQFNLTERLKLQVRAEAFNIFNHPNFGDPGANFNGTNALTSSQFGQSINMLGRSLGSSGVARGFNPLYQVGGPRSMQFALRLQF